jgi:O-glycosyl hydrolase
MVRDVVKRVGERHRAAGYRDVGLVVPNEETVARSIAVARVILEDPEARKFVAAIGYHAYPYGSPYASVRRILRDSGQGRPDAASVRERNELRDLCRRHGVAAWMTEVSHSEVDPRTLDHLRGRAIHIHDEMVYADAAAFYGMNAFWDKRTHAAHFAGRGGERPDAYLDEQDAIALADNDASTVLITGLGYAIGHYARWLKRGAVRIEAECPDPLVQATAFRDDATGRLTLVVINNAAEARDLAIRLSGIRIKGRVAGEQ